MGVGGQRHAPTALPPGKTRYPLYRWLGGPQSRSGWVRKISPQPGFDPRTVQPVASRYTEYAILAPAGAVFRGKAEDKTCGVAYTTALSFHFYTPVKLQTKIPESSIICYYANWGKF